MFHHFQHNLFIRTFKKCPPLKQRYHMHKWNLVILHKGGLAFSTICNNLGDVEHNN